MTILPSLPPEGELGSARAVALASRSASSEAVPPDCETLAVAPRDGVWHVTLNRPALRNAMSLRMVEELQAVLAQAQGSGRVRAIVLRGAGGHFCAGADLKDMGAARQRELAGDMHAVAAANASFGALCAASPCSRGR